MSVLFQPNFEIGLTSDCEREHREAPARTIRSLVDKVARVDLSDMVVVLKCSVSSWSCRRYELVFTC